MRVDLCGVSAVKAARRVAVASASCRNRSRGVARPFASTAVSWIAILGCGAATIAAAEGSPYTITKLYSNQLGDLQYIELRESSASGIVAPLKSSVITVRHGDVTKRFVIPSDPPAAFPVGGTLLIATSTDLSSGEEIPPRSIPPDYVMPVRFLPTDGGTIDLDGADPWTFAPLPIDGSTALLRSGATTNAATRSFAGGIVSFVGGFTVGIEYYNAALDRYFVTASAPDIDAIESGRVKGWQTTGSSFAALTTTNPQCCSMYGQVPAPVCRYYIPLELGDAQFLSAFPEECQAVAVRFPSFVLETPAAFYVVLPEKDTGDCPVPFRPVYRLWNGGASHRLVNSLPGRLPLLSQGWLPEGYGPAGVAWCY